MCFPESDSESEDESEGRSGSDSDKDMESKSESEASFKTGTSYYFLLYESIHIFLLLKCLCWGSISSLV